MTRRSGQHRGDDGLVWVPDWPTVELKAAPAPRRRTDWPVAIGQTVVIVATLIQLGFIGLVWSGHPALVEGAVWTAAFGSWVLAAHPVWLVLQRCRRD